MRYLIAVGILASVVTSRAAITPITCDATGEPLLIRSEGLTERTGSIVLVCEGAAGGSVSGSMTLFVSAPVTNRLSSSGTADVVMTADTDVGRVAIGGSPILVSRALIFESFSFNLPASGKTRIQISNVRVNPENSPERPITVLLSTSGISQIGIRNNPVTVGVVRRSLLANSSSARIFCGGSPLPEIITFTSLLGSNSTSATLRITEAAPAAFAPREPNTTNGTRFLVRYSGFPANARLFVPDLIAGSSAAGQTSAGDLGVPASGGSHNVGGLLLARVRSADSTGAGDMPMFFPGGLGTLSLFEVSEVHLRGGAGYAVYEVVDSSPFVVESAHLPTFLGMPALNSGDSVVTASAQVSYAPISTPGATGANLPIPRFLDIAPPNDCAQLSDCNASYYPKLLVGAPTLQFRVPAGTPGYYSHYITVRNDRGGILNWGATISYRNGSGWLKANPTTGVNNTSIILSAFPERLPPGNYEATLTIDAGPVAGIQFLPVMLEVTPAISQPPPPKPALDPPRFWTVGNSANLTIANLVPGSQAMIEGTRLAGRDVIVAFDGVAAQIVSGSNGVLTVVVPPELAGRPNAQLQITVDSVPSAVQTVPLTAAAPAIFPDGVYNEDGFRNSESNPENVGKMFQIIATGLPVSNFGTISAKIHDVEIESPAYAGPAPGSPGVQRVNFSIPLYLPGMTTEVAVCGTPLNNPAGRVCSQAIKVTIRNPESN